MYLIPREDEEEVHPFVNPFVELNAGLWSLFAGATLFLALRIWVKVNWRHGLWYDDHILIVSWMILLANNSIIIHEFATGYVLKDSSQSWDDRMHILINITSCGTLIGQALTKTAFGVTLLRMGNRWQKGVIWFCIVTMNAYMVAKVFLQWAKVCGKPTYDNWYRFDFCIGPKFREDFKEGGNVYNIIMDFVFATFPWLITRKLEMRRPEKIGLCVTMSLGMIVAIVSAIRVGWKDEGNDRDAHYIWRNGLSQVWYSSEITGTIMVQCIPVFRPLIRDFHTSLTSRKLNSSYTDGTVITTRRWSKGSRRTSVGPTSPVGGVFREDNKIELGAIPEEQNNGDQWVKTPSSSSIEDPKAGVVSHEVTHIGDWPLRSPPVQSPMVNDGLLRNSIEYDQDRVSRSTISFDIEQAGGQGLSAPPRRHAR